MVFYEEYKLLLERISKSLSVEFHDSNKYFKENSNQNDWLFVDTLHLTDQGNAFVTKFVKDLFLPKNSKSLPNLLSFILLSKLKNS